jgi:hypothetical protein
MSRRQKVKRKGGWFYIVNAELTFDGNVCALRRASSSFSLSLLANSSAENVDLKAVIEYEGIWALDWQCPSC